MTWVVDPLIHGQPVGSTSHTFPMYSRFKGWDEQAHARSWHTLSDYLKDIRIIDHMALPMVSTCQYSTHIRPSACSNRPCPLCSPTHLSSYTSLSRTSCCFCAVSAFPYYIWKERWNAMAFRFMRPQCCCTPRAYYLHSVFNPLEQLFYGGQNITFSSSDRSRFVSLLSYTGFSCQGRAKLCAFLRYCYAETMQLSPSFTRNPGKQERRQNL